MNSTPDASGRPRTSVINEANTRGIAAVRIRIVSAHKPAAAALRSDGAFRRLISSPTDHHNGGQLTQGEDALRHQVDVRETGIPA